MAKDEPINKHINSALDVADAKRLKRSVIFGEDVGYFGGVYFGATSDLQEKYGKARGFNTAFS